jgi:glycosyltransferase involved in cell wall biosynthesis
VTKRVALLTHEPFFPPSGGGSAEAIYLVEEFVSRGHELHLFCPTVSDPEEVQRRFKVRLHQFSRWEMGRYTSLRTPKYLLYPSFLRRMVEAVHAATPFGLIFSQHAISAVAAGWLKRSLRIPVIMNFLDYLTGFMETWPPYLAPPPLLRVLKRFELSLPSRYQADGILTVSDTLADFFAESGYPRTRIQPIYYGYDATLFPLRSSLPKPDAPPVVVMHGSLDHHHLRDIGLKAFARVSARRPDVVFKIVGKRTAALDHFVSRAQREAPAAKIESTGFVPYSEVARYLADATVGIVPYEESVGTHCAFVAKIVEYLAVGLPVVSTPLKSARRYFDKEPMIRFSKFEGDSFGDEVLAWLGQSPAAYRDRAAAASERVQRELDWRTISRKALDFVERTVPSAA